MVIPTGWGKILYAIHYYRGLGCLNWSVMGRGGVRWRWLRVHGRFHLDWCLGGYFRKRAVVGMCVVEVGGVAWGKSSRASSRLFLEKISLI